MTNTTICKPRALTNILSAVFTVQCDSTADLPLDRPFHGVVHPFAAAVALC